jgi:hypothetical protein
MKIIREYAANRLVLSSKVFPVMLKRQLPVGKKTVVPWKTDNGFNASHEVGFHPSVWFSGKKKKKRNGCRFPPLGLHLS